MLPRDFALYQNYPNPFNSSTVISYLLPAPGEVSLKIYNISGQETETLLCSHQDSGVHILIWRPQGIASGIYICRLQSGTHCCIKKLSYIR